MALATTLRLPVTFAHVVETARNAGSPADPVDWHVRLSECRERLDRIIAQERGTATDVGRVVLTGSTAQELNGWARDHTGALLAIGTRSKQAESRRGLGSTVQKILDRALASLLLVPGDAADVPAAAYRKLLVPLDGSCRAESVLPAAVRIARAHGAELILAHVVAKVDTIDGNSISDGACELCSKLMDHNESRARAYLEGLRTQVWRQGVLAQIVIGHGDPRDQLRHLAMRHHADLMVVSSHGYTGLADVACGSVTEYLATHVPCPLLIIRPDLILGATEQRLGTSDHAPSRAGELAQ